MEASAEAIDALDKGIRLLEKVQDVASNPLGASKASNNLANISAVSGVLAVDQMALERT